MKRFLRKGTALTIIAVLLMLPLLSLVASPPARADNPKLQAILDDLKKCANMKKDSDKGKNCEGYQSQLSQTIDCSGEMLAEKDGKWSLKADQVKDCQTKVKAADPSIEPSNGAKSGDTNCTGGGLGWIFCPMINYMAKTVQLVAGLIDSLMTVKFLSQESGGASIEQIWRSILTVANILLVVAFMFIIFSQSSSLGLSNYGIKRMLPRLIIAAILMNLSFYICALAIDLSNIIGASVMGFLLGPGNSIASSVSGATNNGNILGGVAAGVAIVGLLVLILTPVVLSIIAVFVVLIARQVILLSLVLVSPLAFVAWLLPNTEKYFKKWSELFFQMLVLYPMVMLMFGAALLLSNLIGASGEGLILGGG